MAFRVLSCIGVLFGGIFVVTSGRKKPFRVVEFLRVPSVAFGSRFVGGIGSSAHVALNTGSCSNVVHIRGIAVFDSINPVGLHLDQSATANRDGLPEQTSTGLAAFWGFFWGFFWDGSEKHMM